MHRSAVNIIVKLIALVRPFIAIMIATIITGTLGALCAMGITILGVLGILDALDLLTIEPTFTFSHIAVLLIVFALSRGILRYLEQSAGHYIAFKLLAFIRDKVFKALRRLSPAKLDGKESGQLMALITSDIELLEVFYAHTIAPVVIAFSTCILMLLIIAHTSFILASAAALAYITIGIIIPVSTSKSARDHGRVYREQVGDMNAYFLESLRGMREVILFDEGYNRRRIIQQKTVEANQSTEKLRKHEGRTRAITEAAILGFSALMLFMGIKLTLQETISFSNFLIVLICLMSSYGPVVALSNLANNLLQTFASGERVLGLLEEKELIKDVTNGTSVEDTDISIQAVNFSYDQKAVLEGLNMELHKNQVIGISGKSGSGKSTLLKLLMRFYDPQGGNIEMGNKSLKNINTSSLRNTIAYVTQNTYLFNDTILENLRIARRNATMEEIIVACKKANVYDFIMQLPKKFDTRIGELGANLSGGERQRIGLARAFLHPSRIILLDEPTSNLDSLNENIILKSLKEHSQDKTIVLVSHRPSTMSIADKIYYFEDRSVS